ncbi:hypothetical protein OHA79_09615 [Streptomyces sp. NBC_00841]|uniref:hypothetical protein n=1 Tax=Streptomyces sp. NBC_00841 TaxID=2975847 RepID=UPI002DDBE710|nr:hypothetical protein [Streptomyces sp. NBC_00841]WRZ98072.1 hypothetical protein OHA79_09615 [Streptomyces sp. NBC_00841]
MSGTRVRINWDVVHSLLKLPTTAAIIQEQTGHIDANVTALGLQSRRDFALEGERARGAVIAGYEDGATAERTRRMLLRSLGGHR